MKINIKFLPILFLLLFTILCTAQNNKPKEIIKIIKCDSIYLNKNIVIQLTNFENEKDGYENERNSLLQIATVLNNKTKIIVKDSIFSKTQKVEFIDFNNDGIKDILVQNISDVRSNWTYNLYFYNPKENTFSKVIGFEKIKNPLFNSDYNIVESYIVSGTDSMYFYKIIKNKIYDYKIEIEDHHNEKFDLDYQKAINKIKKIKI